MTLSHEFVTVLGEELRDALDEDVLASVVATHVAQVHCLFEL